MQSSKLLPLTLPLIVIVCLLAQGPGSEEVMAQSDGEQYVFRRSWGREGLILRWPDDLAIGPDRTMYIFDDELNRIIAIRPDGTIFHFGDRGGWFRELCSVSVDDSGNVYVGDHGGWHGILKFSSTGEYIAEWSTSGLPCGVTVDKNNYVYVLDVINERIEKFTSSGTLITQWDFVGIPGDFSSPRAVTTDSDGNVYIVNNSRVIKFNSDGVFLTEWNIIEPDAGIFSVAYDVAVDENGYVYVADWGQSKILKFDENGVPLSSWGSRGSNPGNFEYPEGIAATVDSGGRVAIYVADTRNARIQRFSSEGDYQSEWTQEAEAGQLNFPQRMELNQNGNIYIADTDNHRVQVFNSSGSFLAELKDQLDTPQGIAIDGSGNIHVAMGRQGYEKIQKYNSDYELLSAWGVSGSGNGQFDSIRGIAVDNNDNIYVADVLNHRIQKFTNDGAYLTQWGTPGNTIGGRFVWPYDIAIDNSNNVYVTDRGNHRVQKFTDRGAFLAQWGLKGTGSGDFIDPDGIATDSFGNVYVVDQGNHRIQKFDSTGTYITQLGGVGNASGQFYHPTDVAVDDSGNVYVLDSGNSRVQMFSPTYPDPDPVSGLIFNGSFEQSTPSLNEWTYGGSLPVSQSDHGIHGRRAMQLAEPVPAQPQGEGQAWAHQTFYVDPSWERPVLSFRYNMFVNDIMDYSDFFVTIQDGVGLKLLATVLRDGYQPCVPNVAPAPGTSLGYRSNQFDLSQFKGQHIRLVFANRNLWSGSWGIWTHVDDVRVVDADSLPPPPSGGSENLFLPMIGNQDCDPVPRVNASSATVPLRRVLP